ncbi:hypothetical protein P3T76_009620 [Phytophthora citrophthora]|uniref:PDZ domain-containing protein n=1 Tax=Phytophthora citrophthora TaxID=4793 RepID=A0AAD9LIF9_9STRA|nr:hypothetical protein P3T76_009620 [Phytophthora citrophthora]
MERNTSDCSPSTAPSASGGSAPKANTGLVTTFFLRSIDWKSKRVSIGTSDQNLVTDSKEQTGEEQDIPIEVEEEPVEENNPPLEETYEKSDTEADKKTFEVVYQCLPDEEENVEEEVDGVLDNQQFVQYLDVLLQTDAHGIGLDVGVRREEEGTGQVLVVQSFRRLSEGDIGPAEACGKILVGDILHAVDGEEVHSLQQLHGKLTGRLGKERKFVLLRFLRFLAKGSRHLTAFTSRRRRLDSSDSTLPDVDALLRENPQIAALVRQLTTTNQVLQEQLIASRLKQEEQNLQLEQLHALYARTQAEGLPLFSLSKSIRPFSRKSNSKANDGLEKSLPTKIQVEVAEAVDAEYARLRQEFQLQYKLDKRELEKKFQEKKQKLEEAAAKKVEMLEEGFRQALRQYTENHHSLRHCTKDGANAKDCGGPLWNDSCEIDGGDVDAGNVQRKNEEQTLRQVLVLLGQYEEMKLARALILETLNPITIPAKVRQQ